MMTGQPYGVKAEPMEEIIMKECNSAVISISMDETNSVGIVGTEGGQVFYVAFRGKERLEINEPIRVISSCNNNQ